MPLDLLPAEVSGGVPFVDYIQSRVGRRSAQRVLAFLQEWDVLADELGREPTLKEYEQRWKMSRATAYNDQRLFQQAFPGERTPRRILDQLWALRERRHGPLLSVKVAVSGADAVPVLAGQLWLDADAGAIHRVLATEGEHVHTDRYGGLDTRTADTLDASSFATMRLIGGAESDVWLVAIQLDHQPDPTARALQSASMVVDSLAAPAVDWGGSRQMRSGTLEVRGVAASEGDLRRNVYDALGPLGANPRDIAIRARRLPR